MEKYKFTKPLSNLLNLLVHEIYVLHLSIIQDLKKTDFTLYYQLFQLATSFKWKLNIALI